MFFWPKVIAASSFTGLLVAQEIPSISEWGKVPLEVLLGGALAYIAIRTYPQMLKDQIEAQQKMSADSADQLDKVLTTHREVSDKFNTTISDKMEKQTTAITLAIKEGQK